MKSGVPQGSILGPLLFLLYINDLPNVTSPPTSIALFADDAKCYRVVRNAEDCLSFQHDLYSVYDWSKDWGLSYNTNKCEVLRISRKRRNQSNLSTVNPYAIDGHPLALVPSTKDLGVIVNNKLTWSSYISSVVAKANKNLGFLYRHFGFSFIGPNHRKSLYLSLVRSHLSYASEIWAPQSCIRDMKLLESVQRRATRFILNCSKDPNNRPNYKSRCHRHRTSLFRDSYFNRIVIIWNNLPFQIRNSASFISFKSRLNEYYFNNLLSTLDSDRSSTWKTICPHCRTVGKSCC